MSRQRVRQRDCSRCELYLLEARRTADHHGPVAQRQSAGLISRGSQGQHLPGLPTPFEQGQIRNDTTQQISEFAQVAQPVEQWVESPRVAGSIPALCTRSSPDGGIGRRDGFRCRCREGVQVRGLLGGPVNVEAWQSGRMRLSRKQLSQRWLRRFESFRFRQ